MAICLRSSLNILRTCYLKNTNFYRKITMSAKLRAEEALEELKKKNPYYEKYASKIATLQQTSPEEFLNRVESVEKKKISPPQHLKKDRNYSELLNPKSAKNGSEEVPIKKLNDIMKIELLQDKTADEIMSIWLEYHKQKKDVLVATIPTEKYDLLMDRSKEYPIFILPLPRSEGYEFFLLQFATNSVHFTPLLCYQVHKENAPECMNISHYTEFNEKHGIVLMRGEYDENVINAQEAQCLVNQLQLYYSQCNNQTKLDLLKKFTSSPDDFKHMDIIKELENLSIK